MPFKSLAEAFSSIKVREKVVNNKVYPTYEVYLGIHPITKKPTRLYASNNKDLKAQIEDFYATLKSKGDIASILSSAQIMDAQLAYFLLAQAESDMTLQDCVKCALERTSQTKLVDITLAEAFEKYLDSKKSQTSDERKKTGATVGKWIQVIGNDKIVRSLVLDDIKDYLKTYYDDLEPSTFNAHLGYIRTFLRWCAHPEQRYIAEDPSAPMMQKPTLWKRPKYMKPEDVENLFRLLESKSVLRNCPEFLALAVTQFFVGVRRAEAIRIASDSEAATIIIDDETFRVDKGKGHTRGRAPRTAHIEENAIAWMKSFDYMNAMNKINDQTTRQLYKFAREHGIPIFKNAMRHTFITMHVAKYHNPQTTQSMVGTSGTMRAEHYDGLAPQKEGEAFFNIFPSSFKPHA